jgi:hypothetical protein
MNRLQLQQLAGGSNPVKVNQTDSLCDFVPLRPCGPSDLGGGKSMQNRQLAMARDQTQSK